MNKVRLSAKSGVQPFRNCGARQEGHVATLIIRKSSGSKSELIRLNPAFAFLFFWGKEFQPRIYTDEHGWGKFETAARLIGGMRQVGQMGRMAGRRLVGVGLYRACQKAAAAVAQKLWRARRSARTPRRIRETLRVRSSISIRLDAVAGVAEEWVSQAWLGSGKLNQIKVNAFREFMSLPPQMSDPPR